MSNYKEEMSTSHHPFHPRKGQPARPMRSYEDIKAEFAKDTGGVKKVKSVEAKEKKVMVAGKMKGKRMKEGHNLIGGGKIYNKLYPGGFKY